VAYPSVHTLVTIRGFQFTTEEEWAFGLRCASTAAPTQAQADAVAAAAKTWIQTSTSGYSAQTTVAAVKLAQIDTTGLYVAGSIARESFPSAATGTYGSAVVHPPQISLAMTMQSTIPRGPGHQTHVFLPGPHFPLVTATLAQISSGNAAAVLSNFRTLALAIQAAGPGNIQVMSKAHAVSANVVTLRLGRAFDTMQSRRTSIPESYDLLAL
jgi:hypothetical protein